MVLENYNQTWKYTDGRTVQSVHPLTTSLIMEYGSNSQGEPYTFEATAYLLPIGAISQQLTRVENKVQ